MECRREHRETLSTFHGLPLKVWLDHGKRLRPAAPMPPNYVPEDFAKLFAVQRRSARPYRDPMVSRLPRAAGLTPPRNKKSNSFESWLQ
jgi:hypothetical protein